MREPAAVEMLPLPVSGRVFSTERIVRFGDISPGGRCRFDALAAFVQDIAGDDTADSALPDESAWVVRRSVLEVLEPARFRETLTLSTFCSGLGSRWAERRVVMHGDRGAHIESVSLWVRIDADTGRPRGLTDQFLETYSRAAGARRVSAQLQHESAPPVDATERPWPLRFADFDLLGHVNNAASWAVIEDELANVASLSPPYRAELEYRDAIERNASTVVASTVLDGVLSSWVTDQRTHALYLTARVAAIT
jgi:acyl-ACP thioesterase